MSRQSNTKPLIVNTGGTSYSFAPKILPFSTQGQITRIPVMTPAGKKDYRIINSIRRIWMQSIKTID